jgi:hypothetical protein
MNQALLQQTALGKRDKPDNSEVDAQTAESKQLKRPKVSKSITKFTKE